MSVVANVAINVDSRNAASKLRQVQTQAQATEKAFGGIAAAVGKLAVAFAGVQAIKFVFTQAAQLQTQARSLEILAGSAEKAGKIIKELQDLGAITPFTSTELIDSAKRLQAFGVETEKVVETTRRLADASGATGAELSGLVTAYGQVQAKGRLQGEELLQFQERGIALQEELRKMYGMTGEEFQKALSKGQVSAKAVEVALQRLTDVGGKYANGAIAQSDTLNGKLSTLQDSFQRLAQNIGKFFEPVFKFLIDGINAFLDRVNNGLRVSAQLKANEQAAIQTRQKFGTFRAINPFDQEAQRYEENLRKSLLKSALSAGRGVAPRAPSAAPAAPALLSPSGGGGRGGRAAGGGVSRAADDAARALEIQKQQYKVADERNTALKDTLALLQETEAVAKRELELDIRLQQIAREFNTLKEEAKSADELMMISLNETLEKKIAQLEAEREINQLLADRASLVADVIKQASMPTVFNEQSGQQKSAQVIRNQINTLKNEIANLTSISNIAITSAEGIGNAFAQSFQGLISGTMTAKEALGSFFKSVADMFLEMAAQIIAKQITMIILQTILKALGGGAFGGLSNEAATDFSFNPSAMTGGTPWSFPTPRANGGPVTSQQPYMVGERGPELFVPGTSGGIVSNGDLRNAMNGASGSSGSPVLNMSFQSTSINGVEYVSREQLEQAMAETRRASTRDGAKRGMTMTLDRIQNSSSTRRKVGI